jgi:hypothetical protein
VVASVALVLAGQAEEQVTHLASQGAVKELFKVLEKVLKDLGLAVEDDQDQDHQPPLSPLRHGRCRGKGLPGGLRP